MSFSRGAQRDKNSTSVSLWRNQDLVPVNSNIFIENPLQTYADDTGLYILLFWFYHSPFSRPARHVSRTNFRARVRVLVGTRCPVESQTSPVLFLCHFLVRFFNSQPSLVSDTTTSLVFRLQFSLLTLPSASCLICLWTVYQTLTMCVRTNLIGDTLNM